jgi:Flp pilus assembly protein TadB
MTWLTHAARRVAGALLAGALLAGALLASALVLPPAHARAAVVRTLSSGPGGPRVAMIVLDMSKALTGVQTEQARRAALSYAGALPSDVRVGLITFNAQWRMALPPTADRDALNTALNGSQRSGQTAAALYGAVREAQAVATDGTSGGRLLVLSEGETVPATAFRPAVPVDVVTWYDDADDDTAALRALATASGGRVAAAPGDSAALAAAFPPAPAASPARAPSPAPGASPVRPHAPAHTATPPRSTAATSSGNWSWELITGLAGVFGALLLAVLLATGSLRRDDRGKRLERQLGRHYRARQEDPAGEREGKVANAVVGWMGGLLGAGGELRLARRLDLAGITRKPAEWILLGTAAGLVVAVVLTLLTGNPVAGVLIGALAGWLGMRLILSLRIAARRSSFAAQLPDVLQLVAGSLQSGFSLPQALNAVVREDSQPAAGEFSRALAETRIGAELEVALDRVADRMDSNDLHWTVMAIRIQRMVGGNLVEVLRTTVVTMRERAQMRRHVKALSAEGRLSAYILLALPLLIGAWLFLGRRSYVHPLYTTPFGLVMLGGAAVLMVLGSLWMRSLIKVEV